MRRELIAVLTAIPLMITLTACGGSNASEEPEVAAETTRDRDACALVANPSATSGTADRFATELDRAAEIAEDAPLVSALSDAAVAVRLGDTPITETVLGTVSELCAAKDVDTTDTIAKAASLIEDARVKAEQEARLAEAKAAEKAEAEAAAEAERLDPATYAAITNRDWQLIEKDPDSHIGEKYVIYGYVTQADAATGTEGFRASTSGEWRSEWYEYDINTIVLADPEIVKTVVSNDLVTMHVEILGAYSYDTQIGGSTTAVSVIANILEVTGQSD